MRRFILLVVIFVLAAILGHFVVLRLVPSVIMNKAMEQMEARGVTLHSFTLAPRTTPQTQTVVRPSPDLAYSICLFDLSVGQSLRVKTGLYDDYASVSFFDARTNNFASVRVGAGLDPAQGSDILLHAAGKPALSVSEFAGPQFNAPSQRGLILIRRLAPTQALFKNVAEIASADMCALQPKGWTP
ncbi:MAG: DUF1254 domain-containing protein [Maricaulaceae bacterium]